MLEKIVVYRCNIDIHKSIQLIGQKTDAISQKFGTEFIEFIDGIVNFHTSARVDANLLKQRKRLSQLALYSIMKNNQAALRLKMRLKPPLKALNLTRSFWPKH